MSQENKALVRRFLGELWNNRNAAIRNEFTVSGYPPAPWGRAIMAAFPDMRLVIEDQVAESDRVVTRVTWRGTHQAELEGVAATGKQVSFGGIFIHKVEGGKLVDHHVEADRLGLMQQLGAIPT
ncbi:MAG: ester cyclase [Chloroflexi bacterium]|nr:ester cyclase [Chloroflexota bacterium]